MSLATVLSRVQNGLQAPQVRVEVHVAGGLPAFTIVGLAETAVRESRDRVRAAFDRVRAALDESLKNLARIEAAASILPWRSAS